MKPFRWPVLEARSSAGSVSANRCDCGPGRAPWCLLRPRFLLGRLLSFVRSQCDRRAPPPAVGPTLKPLSCAFMYRRLCGFARYFLPNQQRRSRNEPVCERSSNGSGGRYRSCFEGGPPAWYGPSRPHQATCVKSSCGGHSMVSLSTSWPRNWDGRPAPPESSGPVL